jgi:hypothetical protein
MDRGAPYTGKSCQRWPCDSISDVQRVNREGELKGQGIAGHGHALCECSWTGEHRLSGAERKRDHQKHKNRLRHSQAA